MTTIYHKFTTDLIFNALKNESEVHAKIKEMSMTITSYDEFPFLNFEELAASKNVLIFGCDYIEAALNAHIALKNGRFDNFYYVLYERLFTSYETLLTGRFSPFLDRFNELSQLVFESGMRMHWKIVLDAQYLKANFKRIVEVEKQSLLMMKDM
jgi:hypothetical protein